MDDAEVDFILDRLERVEKFVPHVYQDSKGLWTLGIGTLVDPKGGGISREEARWLAARRVRRAEAQLRERFVWFATLDPVRQRVFVELVFNMGMGNSKRGMLSFKHTLAAAARGDWERVAAGLRASKWYRDVKPRRANPLIAAVRTGLWSA